MTRGIDYGCGMSNIDLETGIRYGISPLHALGEWSFEEFKSDYGDPHCPDCGAVCDPSDEKDYRCKDHGVFWSDDVFGDPIGWNIDADGYVGWLDDSNDVWLAKSPYKTRAGFCSPCAPGAVYLATQAEDGDWAYCFGPEWFDDGQEIPYDVYDVKTGEMVTTKGAKSGKSAKEVRDGE